MRKRVCLFLILFISLFMMNNKVKAADSIAMWIECNYSVYADDQNVLQENRPIAFIGGLTGKGEGEGYYRLIHPNVFELAGVSVQRKWGEKENPDFAGCWFINSDDIGASCNSNDSNKYDDDEAMEMLRDGKCPAVIRLSNDGNDNLVFAGISEPKKVSRLSKQYIFYKDYGGNINAIGIDKNGYYLHTQNGNYTIGYSINRNLTGYDRISSPLRGYIEVYKEKYTNIAEYQMENATMIFDSNKNIDKLYSAVDNWYDEHGTGLDVQTEEMSKIVNGNNELINACTDLNFSFDNQKKYTFSNGYSATEMLNDLDELFPQINEFYSTYSADNYLYPICSSSKTTSSAVISAYNCSISDLLGDVNYAPDELQEFIISDINKYLTENKGLYLDKFSDNDNILRTLLKCSSYLYANSKYFGISTEKAREINKKYVGLSKGKGITFSFDCESLLGEDLVDKIKSYTNIIKIVVPLLLIVFGLIDFSKAMLGNEDNMKKAQQDFLKRILIAILIFLTPMFLNLILKIANAVWSYISPNSCGLF